MRLAIEELRSSARGHRQTQRQQALSFVSLASKFKCLKSQVAEKYPHDSVLQRLSKREDAAYARYRHQRYHQAMQIMSRLLEDLQTAFDLEMAVDPNSVPRSVHREVKRSSRRPRQAALIH